MSKELAKIIEENGLVYRLAEDGCYYPDLGLEQKTEYAIGKYGIIRAEYLMEQQRHRYLKMVLDGTWNEYLHHVDEECQRKVELAVKRIMKKEGVTEKLKKEEPLEWMRRVNGIVARVEEMILTKFVRI